MDRFVFMDGLPSPFTYTIYAYFIFLFTTSNRKAEKNKKGSKVMTSFLSHPKMKKRDESWTITSGKNLFVPLLLVSCFQSMTGLFSVCISFTTFLVQFSLDIHLTFGIIVRVSLSDCFLLSWTFKKSENEWREGRMSSHTLFLLQLLSSLSLLYFSVYTSWTLSSLSEMEMTLELISLCIYFFLPASVSYWFRSPPSYFQSLLDFDPLLVSASDAEQTKTSEKQGEDPPLRRCLFFSVQEKNEMSLFPHLSFIVFTSSSKLKSSKEGNEEKVQDKRKVSSGRESKKQTTETTQQEGEDLILRRRTNTHPLSLFSLPLSCFVSSLCRQKSWTAYNSLTFTDCTFLTPKGSCVKRLVTNESNGGRKWGSV